MIAKSIDEENGAKQEVIRFETLLWGGDEMLFVLPAWLGFEFLQYFFEHSSRWACVGGERLTHSAGLVFCHAKSPIHRIRKLAQSLADSMKVVLGEHRKQNVWDYIVLESIDYPGDNNISEFNKTRFGPLASHRPKSIRAPVDWKHLRFLLIELIGGSSPLLSRRQLYKIARAIQTCSQQNDSKIVSWLDLFDRNLNKNIKCTDQSLAEHRMVLLLEEQSRDKLKMEAPILAMDLFNLDLNCAPFRACFWFHLIELWDYLIPSLKADPVN
ncbi:MAG: hypothetical protein ACRERV_09430 [Methylococcales bacterium]